MFGTRFRASGHLEKSHFGQNPGDLFFCGLGAGGGNKELPLADAPKFQLLLADGLESGFPLLSKNDISYLNKINLTPVALGVPIVWSVSFHYVNHGYLISNGLVSPPSLFWLTSPLGMF